MMVVTTCSFRGQPSFFFAHDTWTSIMMEEQEVLGSDAVAADMDRIDSRWLKELAEQELAGGIQGQHLAKLFIAEVRAVAAWSQEGDPDELLPCAGAWRQDFHEVDKQFPRNDHYYGSTTNSNNRLPPPKHLSHDIEGPRPLKGARFLKNAHFLKDVQILKEGVLALAIFWHVVGLVCR